MRTCNHAPVFFALLTPSLLLLGLTGLVTPAGPAAAAPLPEVDVCHIPPDDPGNAHTITVSENALPAHFSHGDFAVGEACAEGLGECRAEGTTQCVVGDTCSAVPGFPSDEVCDGRDNDCDGAVDNDPIDLGECTAGVGECAVDGLEVCQDGEIECDAMAAEPPETPEITCDDGRDNDCDGLIDDADPDCVCPCADELQLALDELAEDGAAVGFHQILGEIYYVDGTCDPTARFGFIRIDPIVCELQPSASDPTIVAEECNRFSSVPFGDAVYTDFSIPLAPGSQQVCIDFAESIINGAH